MCIYTMVSLSSHLFLDTGCFQFLTIVNNDTGNIGVPIFRPLGYVARGREIPSFYVECGMHILFCRNLS